VQWLIEWSFVLVGKPKGNGKNIGKISELIIDEAISWAEDRQLGIGGGYKISKPPESQLVFFKFGLTATRANQLISIETAKELLSHIKSLADKNGVFFDGRCTQFEC